MDTDDLETGAETLFESLGFTHPLMALMPYAASAPPHLRVLEDKVQQVMNSALPYEKRLSTAMAVRHTINNLGLGAKESARLATDLFQGINKLLMSPAVLEQFAFACLEEEGVGLMAGRFSSPPEQTLPVLENADAQNRPTLARRIAVSGALNVWTNVSREFAAKQVESLAMCATDLRASLRMLILYLMHADGSRFSTSSSARLDRFETMGLSLWESLLAHLRKTTDYKTEDEAYFGPTVQSAMWHFLRSQDLMQRSDGIPRQALPTAPRRIGTSSMHVVVRGDIPPAMNEEDRQTLARYECLRQPLPVARLPEIQDIDATQARLVTEFPWAETAVKAVTDDLRSRRLFGSLEVGMAPTLLVGFPGCGKSRLARRVAEELAVPFLSLSLAGMGDSKALLGTTRGWASGEPSPLLRLVVDRSSASALVMLDELDKARADTRGDVGPTSALLNLLEVENARSWYDTYLQASCDLSKLMYMATANSLRSIPRPLLTRLRIIHVPEPRPIDFRTIAKGALADIAQEWGLPAATFTELGDVLPVAWARSAREIRAFTRDYLSDWARTELGPGRAH